MLVQYKEGKERVKSGSSLPHRYPDRALEPPRDSRQTTSTSSSEGHSIHPTPWSHPRNHHQEETPYFLTQPLPPLILYIDTRPGGWLAESTTEPRDHPPIQPHPTKPRLSAGRQASYQYRTVYIERRLETSGGGAAAAASARYSEC
jgi:hypothetical protein